jgi:hypothetical protein
MVETNLLLNVPSVYCCKKLDFPTPESPALREIQAYSSKDKGKDNGQKYFSEP